MSLPHSLYVSGHPLLYWIAASSQPSLRSTLTLLEESCSPTPLHLQHQLYSCLWKVAPRKNIGWAIAHLFGIKGTWCIISWIAPNNRRATLLSAAWYRIFPSLDLRFETQKNICLRTFSSTGPAWWYYLVVGSITNLSRSPSKRREMPLFLSALL